MPRHRARRYAAPIVNRNTTKSSLHGAKSDQVRPGVELASVANRTHPQRLAWGLTPPPYPGISWVPRKAKVSIYQPVGSAALPPFGGEQEERGERLPIPLFRGRKPVRDPFGGAAVFDRDVRTFTVQRLPVQGCDTPALGSGVAPWRFRANPS